ncbi:MAG: hypothetical protein ACRCV5_15820 [Afipia sp.]
MFAAIALIVGALVGHGMRQPTPTETFKECLAMQVNYYGDLCAESSVGYEEMNGGDAFYHGVECAVQSAGWCAEAEEP